MLEKHHDAFCLSEKEGKEHVDLLEAMEVAHEIFSLVVKIGEANQKIWKKISVII